MAASRRLLTCAFVLGLAVPTVRPVSAQVTGTTGAIIGTVTDNTKGVMPGVAITVRGPALMGTRTVVTGPDGAYRIPALPPGVYTLVFELAGFGTITRQGIQISLGFTATVNGEMSPAGLAENVTVSGASPVVDLAASKVTTDVGAEQLANLVGSRDQAAVMSLVPGVSAVRNDVGGGGAAAYQKYTAYGINMQNRGVVEGMVTTESACTSGAGTCGELFYSDFDSFEDMAVTVVGNTAEMPQPGTLTVVVAKSGGNRYRGHVYQDYENDSMEGHNIDAAQLALGVTGGGNVAATDVNRLKTFRDFNVDLGGFVVKDKLWWYAAYRKTHMTQRFTNLTDNVSNFDLPVRTAKVTYNLTPNNKLIGYYARSTKVVDNYVSFISQIVTADAVQNEVWPSGAWKGEYDLVLGNAAVLELRAGKYYEEGIFNPNDTAGKPRYQDTAANRNYGNAGSSHSFHDRPQVNGSLTYFKDGWVGTHNFKFGGEATRETNSGTSSVFNNLVMILNNGVASQVQLYLPPASTFSRLWAAGAFAQDAWKVNSRMTVNMGLRFDHYRSYVPPQVGPTGQQFNEITGAVWDNPGLRLGVVYGLTGDGKTLVKASYGQYWQYPFNSGISTQVNPNPSQSFSTYTWTPANPVLVNGLPVYTPGQEGRLLSVTGANPNGQPSVTVDPDIKNTYSRQAVAYFEREVAPNFGVRTGFVWNAWRQGYGKVNANTPYEGFTVPVTVTDPGRDGRLGTGDDGGAIQAFDLDAAHLGLPLNQVLRNLSHQKSDYYTWEITATKRQTGRWSLLGSFANTWYRAGPIPLSSTNTLLYTPNSLVNTVDGRNVYSTWIAKISGTLNVWGGVRFSPVFKLQQGTPFARTFNARLAFNSAVTIMAEPVGAERTGNVAILDMRTEKIFEVKRGTLGLFFDAYNLFNTNVAQTITTSSGSSFLRPSVITGPRVARVGVRFNF